MSEVQKDLKDVSAGIGILKKLKFSCFLRSKSARSTLTSPGLCFFHFCVMFLPNHVKKIPQLSRATVPFSKFTENVSLTN